jgi:putative FmdB family regulatory protein
VPIYDYGCNVCGVVTEVIHGIEAPGPRFCPACGAEGSLRKAISSPSVVFKGSGWAKLDRRQGSGSSGSRAAKGSAPGDGGKEGKDGKDGKGSSDSKPASETGSGESATTKPASGSSTPSGPSEAH